MAIGIASFDLTEVARRRDAFTDLVLRHADTMPSQVELHITPDGIIVPGVAHIDLPAGCGKTTTALTLVSHLAHTNRQVLIAAPTVAETMQVAQRLQVLLTTSMLSNGIDVTEGDHARQVLVIPRTTTQASPTSGYTALRRVAPELFAVANRRPQVPRMNLSDRSLLRPIRRLLARLDTRTRSLAELLTAAIRRLRRHAHTQLDRAASMYGHIPGVDPLGVPVPPGPQLTRGPTESWTNTVLSVPRELAYT
ncbi:hypothetical protein ABT369_26785 [Dactylosporangium sp. NPDC000244]|uniref:hypothetical protein n=1 Tax=unclassified Dactylosporangium TaxID=2621675 RepID=UPI00332108BD